MKDLCVFMPFLLRMDLLTSRMKRLAPGKSRRKFSSLSDFHRRARSRHPPSRKRERKKTMPTDLVKDHDRRRFLKLLAVGGTAAGLRWAFPVDLLHAKEGPTEALLLSCMDYRLVDATGQYMVGRGLKG